MGQGGEGEGGWGRRAGRGAALRVPGGGGNGPAGKVEGLRPPRLRGPGADRLLGRPGPGGGGRGRRRRPVSGVWRKEQLGRERGARDRAAGL